MMVSALGGCSREAGSREHQVGETERGAMRTRRGCFSGSTQQAGRRRWRWGKTTRCEEEVVVTALSFGHDEELRFSVAVASHARMKPGNGGLDWDAMVAVDHGDGAD